MAPRYLKRKTETSSTSSAPVADVPNIVRDVIEEIRRGGDAAVRRYSEKFDKWSPDSSKLSREQIEDVISTVPEQIIKDIKTVQANVRKFAEAQKAALHEIEIETEPGVFLGHKNVPIQNVGA
jgi:histidinol dehydrogenase